MATKKVKNNKTGISSVPKDKPILYKVKTKGGKTNYVGTAKRGRAQERLLEHLAAGDAPGTTVHIEQFDSIADARKKEANSIARTKPKYNSQGK